MARRFRRRQDPTLNRTRSGDVEPENPLYYLRRVSPGAKGFFFEQLSEMFDAGVTAYDALETISHQNIDGRLRSAVEKMVPEISDGASLADQMDRFPELFEPQIRGLIRAGEMSGRLAEITAYIAEELREKQSASWKILLAQIWFTIPLVLIALVLPLPRIIDMGFQWYLNFILRVSIPIVLGITIVYLIGKIVLNLRAVRPLRDRIMYGLPVGGKLVQKAALRRYLQALDALMASGVQIQEGLAMAAESAGNVVVERELKEVADRVRRGQPVGTALTKARSIPPQVRQTLATAERTGNYDRALDEVQTWARQDQSKITQMAAWGGYGLAMLVTAVAVAIAVYFAYKSYVEAVFARAEEWMP